MANHDTPQEIAAISQVGDAITEGESAWEQVYHRQTEGEVFWANV